VRPFDDELFARSIEGLAQSKPGSPPGCFLRPQNAGHRFPSVGARHCPDGLVFNPLRQSLVARSDSADLIPDVCIMHTVSPLQDLFCARPIVACQ
jgi:hypothetical protein